MWSQQEISGEKECGKCTLMLKERGKSALCYIQKTLRITCYHEKASSRPAIIQLDIEWFHREANEPVHPEDIEDMSSIAKESFRKKENFECYHNERVVLYAWIGDFIAYVLSSHWNSL